MKFGKVERKEYSTFIEFLSMHFLSKLIELNKAWDETMMRIIFC